MRITGLSLCSVQRSYIAPSDTPMICKLDVLLYTLPWVRLRITDVDCQRSYSKTKVCELKLFSSAKKSVLHSKEDSASFRHDHQHVLPLDVHVYCDTI
jgi:hypothetical protein